MFVRRLTARVSRRSFVKHSQQWHVRSRQASTAANVTQHPPTTMPVFPSISTELDRSGPRFDINADQVTIIPGPKEFYKTLREKLMGAKKRIYLATLYVGKTESELMSCIEEAIQKNPTLKVSILTDAIRGTRESPDPSCASLLADLAAKYPEQVEIRMYHTPNLTGLRKKYIPKRINEGWGLQHMKLYGVDDEVILSGANLSDDYFTNRQDRYHLLSSSQIAEFFGRVHDAMCSASLLLRPDSSSQGYNLTWPESNACVSPLEDPKRYVEACKTLFSPLVERPSQQSEPTTDTSLYPLLIIPNAINTELPTLTRLMNHKFPAESSYMFTAGYFNPHPSVTSSLLSTAASNTHGTVVTASPWANGFYGSKGVSGMLPPAYTLLSRRFLKAAELKAHGGIELREWRLGTVGRPHGWTYHAKGLWINIPGPKKSSPEKEVADTSGSKSSESVITLIGSSNYTVRSYSLDTEVGAVIATTNPALCKRLEKEQENLLEHSRAVNLNDLQGGERRVGIGVRIAMWIVTAVGGSL